MQKVIVFLFVALLCTVLCQPLDLEKTALEYLVTPSIQQKDVIEVYALEWRCEIDDESKEVQHHLSKRFINPMFALGGAADSGVSKMRTKRQADECEKLALCKLHARSQNNFMAAFQLYFVNKENARLWDHHARSISDCQERYGDCYE